MSERKSMDNAAEAGRVTTGQCQYTTRTEAAGQYTRPVAIVLGLVKSNIVIIPCLFGV